jgi:hypothetical protein
MIFCRLSPNLELIWLKCESHGNFVIPSKFMLQEIFSLTLAPPSGIIDPMLLCLLLI